MTKHLWTLLVILFVWLSLNDTASAGVIVSWNLNGEPGNQASTAANSVALVTGMPVTRGEGISAFAGANSINSSGWNTLSPDDYFSFGFTVASGYRVNLDQLFIGTQSSNRGPGTVLLRYNGDGFTTNLHTFTQSGVTQLNSVVPLDGLTGLTGSVEFRLFSANNTSADGQSVLGNGTFRITNYFDGSTDTGSFGLSGNVEAIPEPSSLALMGLLGMGAAAFWIRRRATGLGLQP